MKNHLIKLLLLLPALWVSSCSKSNDSISLNETGFNTDILNKVFLVAAANSNNGTDDITADFSSYGFRFVKNTATSGSISANNDLLNFNGTWSTNSDFTTLTISFAANAPADFSFFNDNWKITAMTDTYFNLVPVSGNTKTLNFVQK